MRERMCKGISVLAAVCILLGSAILPVQASNPGGAEYLNTYINTGNQRQDIIGVAMTQVGYMEKYENDTKYGDWYGFPDCEWCAMFVSWCARQADVSGDILRRISWAHPNSFGIPYYHGNEYTPLPGDLFFTEDFSHVGLVLYVEGEFFYCVEGNAKYHDYTVPNDPEVDSYHVMTNKRLISAHYFGVPDYEGCDKAHTYTKGYETEHPHKTYYACSSCGDKYYTGYTECFSDCSRCMSCFCSNSYAGYYLVSADAMPLNVRSSHSASSESLGYVTPGAAVYVYGMEPGTGRAYVEYDGLRGHIWSKYLEKYYGPPEAPTVTVEQAEYVQNEDVTVRWSTPENTEQYKLRIFRDGELYLETGTYFLGEEMHQEAVVGMNTSYTLETLPGGLYEVQVLACNRSGYSDAGIVKFTVRDTYTVTYDPNSGSGAPEPQTQVIGEAITLSNTIPTRSGYSFLGWTEETEGKLAVHKAGAEWNGHENTTLYAVWKKTDAAPHKIDIWRMPEHSIYLRGEHLDTDGLVLRLTYSDGAGCLLNEGYTVEGFDSETYGEKTVTVSHGGLTASFDVQVVPYLPGDMDLNKTVDRDDVIQLLWHITFPERFPITVPADFNSDGAVDRDDVMQLLWHIAFPERFPLDIVWPEEAFIPGNTGTQGSEEGA